jgi:putative phosphoesterase
MKIAVLSDIHSNYHALRTCVDFAIKNKVDHFLFLGDYVSDCAYPHKTMHLLYELKEEFPCWFIKGNREEYILDHHNNQGDGWKIPSSASGSLLYTYNNLSDKDLTFFHEMDISGVMSIEGYPQFLYCHGSMEHTKGDLRFGRPEVDKMVDNMTQNTLLCGHTHKQGIYEKNGKRIVNVGSVGVPWDYQGDAQFAILSGYEKGWEIELLQIKYDKKQAVKELYESGLSEQSNIWAKLVEKTLLTGIDEARECLQIALKLCEKEEGEASWSKLSEKYWEAAAKEMGYLYRRS